MDVPENLRGTFKLFEAHGGKLKEQNPGGLKRSIKYDDTTMSICMDVRLSNRTRWHRISANQMREIAARSTNKSSNGGGELTEEDVEDLRRIHQLPSSGQGQSVIPVVPIDSDDEDREDRWSQRSNNNS